MRSLPYGQRGSAPNDDLEAEKSKACVLKVVMTGSAEDGPAWQTHIRSKNKPQKLANRFRDPKDSFRIAIVRDMWLTGFDAPCLHTMYADKPMQGHGLMQAIARVNRVFRDKPGGLVVDCLRVWLTNLKLRSRPTPKAAAVAHRRWMAQAIAITDGENTALPKQCCMALIGALGW